MAASARFAKAYSEICYPAGADVSLVTRISHTVIDQVLPTAQHCAEVLTNPVMKLHLIVDRARGLTKVSNSLLQGAALANGHRQPAASFLTPVFLSTGTLLCPRCLCALYAQCRAADRTCRPDQ